MGLCESMSIKQEEKIILKKKNIFSKYYFLKKMFYFLKTYEKENITNKILIAKRAFFSQWCELTSHMAVDVRPKSSQWPPRQ